MQPIGTAFQRRTGLMQRDAPAHVYNDGGNENGDRGRDRLQVAVIGGGITGLTLALGLEARGVAYTIYERAASLGEIGAGIGLSPNAERALRAIDPRAHEAFKRVAAPNGEDWFQWVDGTTDELLYRLWLGGREERFQGCRRSDLLDELAGLVPKERVRFGKRLDSITENGEGEAEDGSGPGRLVLRFRDGTAAEADVVIGCDGIHSCVRRILLGADSPAAHPSYTGKYCFRTVVPMARVAPALAHRMHTRFMFNGPSAHAITYPVGARAEVLNVLLVVSDPDPAEVANMGLEKHATSGSKREAVAAFEGWHPTVRAIVDLFPDNKADDDDDRDKDQGKGKGIDKWAIFDTAEHPAPYYARGRICVAGDAAHASSPHLGSGAGFGIEDALALAALLAALDGALLPGNNDETRDGDTTSAGTGAGIGTHGAKKGEEDEGGQSGTGDFNANRASLCSAALEAYNNARYARTVWLPGASREACALFEWEDAGGAGRDPGRFGEEISRKFRQIWDYDVDRMVREALAQFAARSN
ncbi:hypothetical protein DL764_002982 [Monosporascus ibericus]|uniref:FAD-binding domain-containing protein n=1 Tax=Monosporascus ibericus TaxID=155417 RepID=A0A4Q4TMD7_9PEZI|nr:hypothetical protein DL764_002982 [Monosporascus ibericus]